MAFNMWSVLLRTRTSAGGIPPDAPARVESPGARRAPGLAGAMRLMLVRTFLVTLAGMTLYEVAQHALLLGMPGRQSQVVTVLALSLVATIASGFVWRHYMDVAAQVSVKNRERLAAEGALLEAREVLELRVRERTRELENINAVLQTSEERYRAFVETSSEGIWCFELEEPISVSRPVDEQVEWLFEHAYMAECNEVMARMYGFESAADLRGIRLPDLLDRSDEANWEYLRAFIQSGYRLLDAESSEIDRSGSTKYFLNNLTGVCENEHFLRAWGSQRDVTDRKLHEQAIRWQAFHDSLTGLPNRAHLQHHLEQVLLDAQASGSRGALLFLDLDNFKEINDSLGHEAGDRLLRDVAERLAQCAGGVDEPLARMGGDEFTILLPEIGQPEDAAAVAQKLLDLFDRPVLLDGHELFVAASIGISLFPEDGADAPTLLKNADVAMYRAKDQGRNRYQFYDEVMAADTYERLVLGADLRKAIERGQLCAFYQPLVDLGSGRMTGVEALLRWQHPVHGAVPPATFIPLAEMTGLIIPLGEWVLEAACREAVRWQRAGHPLTVSVNLSARQFRQPDLASVITAVLARAGLDPQWLSLELTESAVIENHEFAVQTLTALKGTGVRISIDDFGTGYSSLAYLRRFPVDVLKVDRSFICALEDGAEDQAIVRAIIDLAHALGMEVVAEGVETEGQVERLRRLNCDKGQGYLFSPPVPTEGITRFLAPLHEPLGRQAA